MMTSSGLRIYPESRFKIVWHDISPDAGDPLCVCSFMDCRELIKENEVPMRIYGLGKPILEARFHTQCWNEISPHKFDLHLQETEDYPEDLL